MKQYLDAVRKVLSEGHERGDRTGVGTISTFGLRMEFDCHGGAHLPIVTAKHVPFKSILVELLWFLRGETNISWLKENGCSIWDEWADANGELGPVYGKQWRDWEYRDFGTGWDKCKDQIAELVKGLQENPLGRRHIVSAWNVADLDAMALPPCHMMFQCYVRDGFLDMQMYQRSADMFLGVPFNITSYCILLHMLAKVSGLKPGKFVWVGGDCHVYLNHLDQVSKMLDNNHMAPRAWLQMVDREYASIDDFKIEDFALADYVSHGKISAPVAV